MYRCQAAERWEMPTVWLSRAGCVSAGWVLLPPFPCFGREDLEEHLQHPKGAGASFPLHPIHSPWEPETPRAPDVFRSGLDI